MSIPVKERVARPSSMGIPCQLCIKAERISQCVSHANRIIDQGLASRKLAFYSDTSIREQLTKDAEIGCSLTGKKKKKKNQKKDQDQEYAERVKIFVENGLRRGWLDIRWEAFRKHSLSKVINRLNNLGRQFYNDHPKCAGCSILFGECHIENPNETPIGTLCGVCYNAYRDMGREVFLARLRIREENDE